MLVNFVGFLSHPSMHAYSLKRKRIPSGLSGNRRVFLCPTDLQRPLLHLLPQ